VKKVLALLLAAAFLVLGLPGLSPAAAQQPNVVQDSAMIDESNVIMYPSDFSRLSYDSDFVYCAKINFNTACDSNYKVDYSYYLFLDNTQADGAKLPLNASACSDSLDSVDTVDWWTLNLTSNGTLDITMTVPSTADFDLGLADPAGNFVAHSANATLGATERISYTKTSSSPEILGLRVNWTAGSGSYFITANFNGTGETGAQTSCRANKPAWGDKKASARKYKDTFSDLGANIPPLLGDNYYCVKEVAKGAAFPPPTQGVLYVNATCDRTLVTPTTYYDTVNFPVAANMGRLDIGLKTTDFKFSAPPGSNISISPFEDLNLWSLADLLNPTKTPAGDTATQAGRETLKTYAVSYLVRNISSATVIQPNTSISTTDILLFPWKASFAIPATAPVGIIELSASNGTNWGTRYIAYQAVPTTATFTINNAKSATLPAGSTARISAIATNYYGTLFSVFLNFTNWPETSSLSIRYANGSTASATVSPSQPILNLPPESGSYAINVSSPSTAGTYRIDLTMANSVSGGYFLKDSVTLVSTPSPVRLEGLNPVYTPGQTLNISVGVLDQAGAAVDISALTLTIKDPAAATVATLGLADTTLEANKYRRALYTLPTNATVGTYAIAASVTDTSNTTYSGTFAFNVSAPVAGLSFDPSSISISESVTTLALVTKQVNVTNTGAAAVNITGVAVSDSIKGNVVADSILGSTLNAAASAVMQVIIIPNDTMADGTYSGSVTVSSDGQVAVLPVSFNVALVPADISLNSSVSLTTVTTETLFDVPFANSGARRVGGVAATKIEDDSNIIRNITAPTEVGGNTTSQFTLAFQNLKVGNYTAKVRVSGTGVTPKESSLSIVVLADFKSDINALAADVSALIDEIYTIREVNKINVGTLDAEANALNANVSQLASLYSSKQYDRAATLLAELRAKAASLKSSAEALLAKKPKSAVCGDLVCGQGETAASCPADCGPKTVTAGTSTNVVFVVIVIIIVIIAGVILALSIVPEETPAATTIPPGY